MNIRLMCFNNPRALGIVDGSGHVHLERLEEHVKVCSDCRPFFRPAILALLRKLIRQTRPLHPPAGARVV